MGTSRKIWLALGLLSLLAGMYLVMLGYPATVAGGVIAGANVVFSVIGLWKNIPFS